MTERWQIIEGDCLEVMRGMADKSVDHVITDPPYEAKAHTKARRIRVVGTGLGAGISRKVCEAPLPFPPICDAARTHALEAFARTCRRWALVFSQAEAAHKWASASDVRSVRWCVWIKPDAQPQFTGDRPGVGYETIVALHAAGRTRWNGGGRCGVFVHTKNDATAFNQRNVHPTQKPLPLMLELVELFTDPDDLILDPFCGSGTTGVACLRLGRRFIGIEKDPKYAALARERLEAEAEGSTLQARRAGQVALFGGGK